MKERKGEYSSLDIQPPTSKNGKKASDPHFNVECSVLDVRCSTLLPSYLKKHLKLARSTVRAPLTELTLALVNDKKMSALHLQFLNIPGPTDVLTFPLELNAGGKPTSGEVVICVPEARRRAREHKTELKDELLLYALHGLLHLCGFDDRTDRQYREMHRMEDKILTQLGVGPVFGARAAAGDD